MKQKIVVEVSMYCDSCRRKALKIASVAKGRVHSVALEGGDRDRVVVIGEDVDSVCLTKDLRKKFRHATIVSVKEVKEKAKEKEADKEKKTVELPLCHWTYPPYPPMVAYDQYRDDSTCTIVGPAGERYS